MGLHPLPVVVAALLLGHACYTDLRWRKVRNGAVVAACVFGVVLGVMGGWPGVLHTALGLAAGGTWWIAVALCGFGSGDAKLAMAVGALLGPVPALAGPAVGCVLCALAILPWAAVRRSLGRPWRGEEIPLAPWIAAGVVLASMWH